MTDWTFAALAGGYLRFGGTTPSRNWRWSPGQPGECSTPTTVLTCILFTSPRNPTQSTQNYSNVHITSSLCYNATNHFFLDFSLHNLKHFFHRPKAFISLGLLVDSRLLVEIEAANQFPHVLSPHDPLSAPCVCLVMLSSLSPLQHITLHYARGTFVASHITLLCDGHSHFLRIDGLSSISLHFVTSEFVISLN